MRKGLIAAGIVLALAALGFLLYAFGPVFVTVKVDEAAPLPASPSREPKSFRIVATPGHPAEGEVLIVETAAGPVVRFENFKTLNGPDLFVYLAKDLEAREFVNLGPLKGTEGNANYAVPEGVELAEYPYVMTWCRRFGVLFNYAEID